MVELIANFERNLSIDLDYQYITVFGTIGAGKSTILNALGGNFEANDDEEGVTKTFTKL